MCLTFICTMYNARFTILWIDNNGSLQYVIYFSLIKMRMILSKNWFLTDPAKLTMNYAFLVQLVLLVIYPNLIQFFFSMNAIYNIAKTYNKYWISTENRRQLYYESKTFNTRKHQRECSTWSCMKTNKQSYQ